MRRLEAFARSTHANHNLSPNKIIHVTREWRAILNAPGFPKGFQLWWACRPHRYPGVPYDLPNSPLPADQAALLCQTFETEVRALEEVLIQELKAKARASHEDNPNKVFRDMQKPQVPPIQMLTDISTTTVTAVEPDEQAFCFDVPAHFDPEKSLLTPHGPMKAIVVEEDKIWVENLNNLQPGDEVTQETHIGDLTSLFDRFGDDWAARWDKHRHTPEAFWDPLLEFIDMAIPAHEPMKYERTTADQIRQVIKSKKPTAAAGSDGWSRQDILRMAPDLLQSIADLFHWIENGHPWPLSLVTGVIHALEKKAGASQVKHFRPITIFSLIYRAWSSVRSRQILAFLTDQVPLKCFGNVPKKTAKDVWFGIQRQIEDHYFDNKPLTGCMLDLVKAFNHLPRLPVMKIGVTLGIAPQILQAWTSALHVMERRFYIRGATGPPLRSCSGFPEGCGMSVVGMMLINVITDRWLQVRVPRCTLWSYVDNLEITASNADEVQQGYAELSKVLNMLDIPIDTEKTIFWSTQPKERKTLRETESSVVFWTRDLGGHVQYSQQMTNSIVTGKISSFQPRWKVLAASKASYRRKLHAIKALAWPNMLHGIASAFVGANHFDDLRTAALRALGEHRPGTSPVLHLSMVCHPSSDPGFYAIWITLLETRKYISVEAASPILTEASKSSRLHLGPGPCHLLLRRMYQLHWHWHPMGKFIDEHGEQIDIWHAPLQELQQRACEAWQTQIAGTIAARKTFTGMQHTHAMLSNRKQPYDHMDRSLLRTVMNGTFYTADHLPKRDESLSSRCPFCGEEDSVFHRNWQCQALEEARMECPMDVRTQILNQPPAFFNHGWVPAPPTLQAARRHSQHTHTKCRGAPAKRYTRLFH